jgi:hypothetical protein
MFLFAQSGNPLWNIPTTTVEEKVVKNTEIEHLVSI